MGEWFVGFERDVMHKRGLCESAFGRVLEGV
jgi:hypothetical protein